MPAGQALLAVDAEASRFQAAGGQPGIAYGVIAGGALVHSGGLGERRAGDGTPPDADTCFRIASMTKSFTASAMLLLRDESAVRLDDPASRYVPELAPLRGPTTDSPEITIRHLLTMAAGFPTDDPWGDRQQGLPAQAFTEVIRQELSFAWTPGTAFEYSNLGYALLGRVIEACSGMRYRDFVARRLLVPLGLTSTGFDADVVPAQRLAAGHRRDETGWRQVPLDPYGSFAPMGGLFSTVTDLARWVSGFTDAFPPRDDPEFGHPLCRATRREQQQSQRDLAPQLIWPTVDALPRLRASGYGLGLFVEHDPVHGLVVGHSGGYPGFGSHMRWHPRTGLGVVVLGNATYAMTRQPATQMLTTLVTAATRPQRRSRRTGPPGPSGRRGQATPAWPAPRGEDSWPATLAARHTVEGLVAHWDDDVAAGLFAENVDLDQSLDRRRAELERIRDRIGPPVADPDGPVDRSTPAHLAWWMRGPRGRLRLEILLTPQFPPRVQSLTLTVAADPKPELRDVVERIVAELARPCPHWPDAVATSMNLDRPALTRMLRVAAAWAGACDIAGVLAGDGETHARFRLAGERADLDLTVGVDRPHREPGATIVRAFRLGVQT